MNKITQSLLTLLVVVAGLFVFSASVFALNTQPTGGNNSSPNGSQQQYEEQCDPAVPGCDGNTAKSCSADKNCSAIFTKYLIPAINLLSAAVGVIVVAVIIFSGIQFSASGGSPEAVASAKKHITNAIIALLAFFFLWAFLNFIIPGGLFSGTTKG